MAKAIFAYFQAQSPIIDASQSSMDDLKFEDAAPIIKKTWTELMRDKVNVGAKIYDFILTKEITMSKLFMDTNIEQQSGIFMTMMDNVVGFLDDATTLNENLKHLGTSHVDKYKIKTKHFKHFRSAFLKAIKRYIPWTDRREQAWQWFWGIIISSMSHATQANHYPLISQFNGKELKREEMIEFAQYIHITFDTALTTDPKLFADNFYKNLLNEQPDIAQLFNDANTSFERQSSRFIAMLNHAIKLLDDTNTFSLKLESLSSSHVDYGVQIPMLQSFGDVLISQVKQLNVKYYNIQQGQKESNNNNNNKNTNTNTNEQKEQQLAAAQLYMFNVPKWTTKHDDAWSWFWKIVVGIFSQGMTKKINQITQQQNNNKKRINKNEIENQDFSQI